MDAVAWEWIERQEDAWVQVWHAKQGVFRKKLPPDVRDDLMKGPCWENESMMDFEGLWETASRKSTVESWEGISRLFHPFCISSSSLDAFVFSVLVSGCCLCLFLVFYSIQSFCIIGLLFNRPRVEMTDYASSLFGNGATVLTWSQLWSVGVQFVHMKLLVNSCLVSLTLC